MRDTRKSEEYFAKKMQSDAARIAKFEAILQKTDPANQRGLAVGNLQLFTLCLSCTKSAYSVGAALDEVYSWYLRSLHYYKEVCTSADSTFDVIDLLSMGVLFQRSKAGFLPALETITEKFASGDGMISFLLGHLQERSGDASPSQLDYFNRLMKGEEPSKVLSDELSQWYRHHKAAHWYNSHNSKSNSYCGYWCYEIAALAKIFGVDDAPFAHDPYYPYDLAHL